MHTVSPPQAQHWFPRNEFKGWWFPRFLRYVHHHLHPFFSMWWSPFQTQKNHQNILVWFPLTTVKTKSFSWPCFVMLFPYYWSKKAETSKLCPFVGSLCVAIGSTISFSSTTWHRVITACILAARTVARWAKSICRRTVPRAKLSMVFSMENLETFENHRMNIS